MKNILTKFGTIIIMVLTMSTLALAQADDQPANTESTNTESPVKPQTVRPPIVPSEFTPSGQFIQGEGLLIPNAAGNQAPQEQFFGGIFLPTITNTIISLAGGFAFVFMIVGGIQILTAYGNEERVSAGKKTMTYAIVGLLVAILSYAIVSIISAINLNPQQGNQQQEQEEGGDTESTTETTSS